MFQLLKIITISNDLDTAPRQNVYNGLTEYSNQGVELILKNVQRALVAYNLKSALVILRNVTDQTLVYTTVDQQTWQVLDRLPNSWLTIMLQTV